MELRVSSTEVNSFARVEFGPMLLTGTVFSAEHQSVNLILGYRLTTRSNGSYQCCRWHRRRRYGNRTTLRCVARDSCKRKLHFRNIQPHSGKSRPSLRRKTRRRAPVDTRENWNKDFSRILKRYLVWSLANLSFAESEVGTKCHRRIVIESLITNCRPPTVHFNFDSTVTERCRVNVPHIHEANLWARYRK